MRLAVETLEELDWCLDQLESLQVRGGGRGRSKHSRKVINKKRVKCCLKKFMTLSIIMHN